MIPDLTSSAGSLRLPSTKTSHRHNTAPHTTPTHRARPVVGGVTSPVSSTFAASVALGVCQESFAPTPLAYLHPSLPPSILGTHTASVLSPSCSRGPLGSRPVRQADQPISARAPSPMHVALSGASKVFVFNHKHSPHIFFLCWSAGASRGW